MKSKRTFAELRCVMIRHNVSQRDLAAVAGIADATMTDRFAGRSYFRVDEINRIAKYLNIHEDDYYKFFLQKKIIP